MFETIYGHRPHGAGDSTMREPRSGFSGFGGRPSLHPAWRDDDAGGVDARVIPVPASPARQVKMPA